MHEGSPPLIVEVGCLCYQWDNWRSRYLAKRKKSGKVDAARRIWGHLITTAHAHLTKHAAQVDSPVPSRFPLRASPCVSCRNGAEGDVQVMTEMRHHPAIYAGLMGSATLGVPAIAFAAPLDSMVRSSAGPIVLQVAIGCATGAALAGGIAYVAERIYVHNHPDDGEDEAQHEGVPDESERSEASVVAVQSLPLNHDEGAHDIAPASHDGQFEIETAVLDELELQRHSRQSRHLRQARHLDQDATIRIIASEVNGQRLRSARHLVAAGQSQAMTDDALVAVADIGSQARHFAPSVDRDDNVPQNLPVVEEQQQEQPEQSVSEMPVVKAAETPVASAGDGARAGAKKPNLFARVAAKVKGIRTSMVARLADASSTDDIPIIKRADGSNAEVATPRLNQVIAPMIETLVSSLDEPSDTDQFDMLPASEHSAEPASNAATSQSAYISRRVSEVEVGLFPERRSIDELEKGDMWEEALVAMGDALGQESSQRTSADDRPSMIDETRRIEVPSERVRLTSATARANPVDTDTYVDYLLRDELSHSGNEVLRSSPHAHLRVIEGGTGSIQTQKRAGQTSKHVKKGRHYASENIAREA